MRPKEIEMRIKKTDAAIQANATIQADVIIQTDFTIQANVILQADFKKQIYIDIFCVILVM